jgi:hypothetical protein
MNESSKVPAKFESIIIIPNGVMIFQSRKLGKNSTLTRTPYSDLNFSKICLKVLLKNSKSVWIEESWNLACTCCIFKLHTQIWFFFLKIRLRVLLENSAIFLKKCPKRNLSPSGVESEILHELAFLLMFQTQSMIIRFWRFGYLRWISGEKIANLLVCNITSTSDFFYKII